MDLNQASFWRKSAGRTCALFCLLACFALLDGLIAKFREPVNVFHVLPGDVVDVNGPLPENIKRPEALTCDSDSPDLDLVFEAVHSGYFLGGNMWRGRLAVGRNSAPGKYEVTVRPRDYPRDKPGFQIRVVVYADALSQRTSFRSFIKRQTGISPFLAAAAFLPLIGIILGGIFLLSSRIETLLARLGKAEIYKVSKGEGCCYVAFGLGRDHGINPGDEVKILDPEGKLLGKAEVQEVSAKDAVALARMDPELAPGCIASRDG